LWFNHRLRQAPNGLEDLPDVSITAFSQLQESIDALLQLPAYAYN
jgi:putative hydrolase of the HAD superfamily